MFAYTQNWSFFLVCVESSWFLMTISTRVTTQRFDVVSYDIGMTYHWRCIGKGIQFFCIMFMRGVSNWTKRRVLTEKMGQFVFKWPVMDQQHIPFLGKEALIGLSSSFRMTSEAHSFWTAGESWEKFGRISMFHLDSSSILFWLSVSSWCRFTYPCLL